MAATGLLLSYNCIVGFRHRSRKIHNRTKYIYHYFVAIVTKTPRDKLQTWVSTLRHIVWETYVFLLLLSNVLSASLAAGLSEYGAVSGGGIITFITN